MATISEAAADVQNDIDNNRRILSFIDNIKLIECVKYLFNIAIKLNTNPNENDKIWNHWEFWDNGVDPFATIASTIIGKREKIEDHFRLVESVRQADKTITNAIGHFHQRVLVCLDGCFNPGERGGVDLIVDRPNMKIIAELKNRHSTTKGDDKVRPYDKLASYIDSKYIGYIAYYVNIIPVPKAVKGYAPLNKPFTPSEEGVRRQKRDDIRIIDGKSFYELLTGEKDSLFKLYSVFPKLISYCAYKNDNSNGVLELLGEGDAHFKFLWDHIYSSNHGGNPPKV